MTDANPRLHGHALRALIQGVESPVVGGALYRMLARRMGIEAMLAEPVPDGEVISLDPAPVVWPRGEARE